MTLSIINNEPKTEILSTYNLPGKRVYFRMRNNSRIRRARLLVSAEEGLVIESPRRKLNLDHAHRVINRRKNWILDAIENVKQKQQRAFDIKDHLNSVLILGKEKTVHVRLGQTKNFVIENERRIYLGFEKQRVRKLEVEAALEAWMRDRAKRYLPLRVKALNRDRFKINEVFVKDQKTIWGSCSSDHNINLNWRLIMAPRFVCDYIILHELCHTRYLNHSQNFWDQVRKTCPNYEKAEAWIGKYGFLLHINLFNWL